MAAAPGGAGEDRSSFVGVVLSTSAGAGGNPPAVGFRRKPWQLRQWQDDRGDEVEWWLLFTGDWTCRQGGARAAGTAAVGEQALSFTPARTSCFFCFAAPGNDREESSSASTAVESA